MAARYHAEDEREYLEALWANKDSSSPLKAGSPFRLIDEPAGAKEHASQSDDDDDDEVGGANVVACDQSVDDELATFLEGVLEESRGVCVCVLPACMCLPGKVTYETLVNLFPYFHLLFV